MKLRSDAEYEAAMREFSRLEGRSLDAAEAERKSDLEGAIAAYAAKPGQPGERKGRPPLQARRGD
ncbi:MAG: hypothetical protein WD341_10190 [Tistlia sp.]|uniref:hypothetical protein n=1 Tax=Tistlia sp. TaxID=3057121 RepID=UPI0034A238FD